MKNLFTLAHAAGYNEPIKAEWKKKSLALLRRIAKDLQLPKGTFDIRFNPGGIAVSGDATLHHDSFYLQINDFGGYWRTCKGRKDYTGGANHNFNTNTFYGKDLTQAQLVAQIQKEVFPVPAGWESV